MPTAKPRVNVAMDQADFDLLSAFAASQGVSRASVMVELWQMAAPVMARVLKLVEEARRAKESVRKGIVEATVEAEAKVGDVVRKISVFQGWPQVPSFFDFAVLSAGSLTKTD